EQSIEEEPPPAYSKRYGEVDLTQDGFDTKARIAKDGRVDINIHQQSRKLSNLLVPALRSQLNLQHDLQQATATNDQTRPILGGVPDHARSPPLNVVVHVVGSRGDVQPFVALGKVLQERYGHRIRLATHPTFRSFVEENGLEFFSIGGDPAELMAFMVKNPGLMPGMDSLRSGDVGKRRKTMYEIVQGCWRSCIEVGDGTGTAASDDDVESPRSPGRSFDRPDNLASGQAAKPFVADAIIANPPSFAHIHCAEKLGIPLHLMFTMPWSPTQAFPHPLANVQSSNTDQSITNFMSYALVEMMTWQGLGDIINRFREKSLELEPVSLMSPALISKPKDWGSHISVSGFYFLSLASHFFPDPDLATFLESGPPPVYIGFGSIVVDDPDAMTRLIFDAIKKSNQRALVSKGWGGLGSDLLEIPDNVFMLGNVPHDWLFKYVSCVVHHGGAGTTAAGIAAGKPTVVVPFFGDQPFWGSMVANAGAGPRPIPSKQLTSDKLAAAILEALRPEALQRAQELGVRISSESGADQGAEDFQDKLDVNSLRCSVAPGRAAAWRVKRTNIRLSSFAATVLGAEGLLKFDELKLYRPREYDTEDGPWDPFTGATSAIMGTIGSMMMGVADLPIEFLRALHIKPSPNPNADALSQATSHTSTPDSSSIIHSSISSNIDHDTALPPQNPEETITESTQGPSDISKQQTLAFSQDSGHGKSMAQKLNGSVSRSSSRDRSSPGTSVNQPLSDNQCRHISLDAAVGAGKGIGRIVGVGLKSPMDFTLSIARGFHNAPRLYGDESVRHPDKVTGIRSGLKAAGKEFGFGVYDGVSGLFTQPFNGAKHGGVGGFIKGFGKGIGGSILKPSAAYTMHGIYKELQKQFGSSVNNYIIAARMAQGYEELAISTQQERLEIVKRWQATRLALHKEKEQLKTEIPTPSNCVFLRAKTVSHPDLDEKRKHARNGRLCKAPPHINDDSSNHNEGGGETVADHPSVCAGSLEHADTSTFEEAIQSSVKATSRGDREEDALIERAIRASVMELRAASKAGNTDETLQRAIQASVAEAALVRGGMSNSNASALSPSDEGLRLSLQQSLSYHPNAEAQSGVHDDSGVETGDKEDVNLVSKPPKVAQNLFGDDEMDLNKTLEQSRLEHEQHAVGLEKERTEEEIVLEYVKKQSLLEEQRRLSHATW
ncbi:MAG: hypothetical protein L6R35_005668, partial [Caloplaca aegaea]